MPEDESTYVSLKLRCAWRLENPDIYAQYAITGRRIARECHSAPPKERARCDAIKLLTSDHAGALPGKLKGDSHEALLLHGVNPKVLLGVLSSGMRERFAGMNGSNFGDGIYFAEDAAKSDQYARFDSEYDESSPLHAKLYLDPLANVGAGTGIQHPGCTVHYLSLIHI